MKPPALHARTIAACSSGVLLVQDADATLQREPDGYLRFGDGIHGR